MCAFKSKIKTTTNQPNSPPRYEKKIKSKKKKKEIKPKGNEKKMKRKWKETKQNKTKQTQHNLKEKKIQLVCTGFSNKKPS